MASEKYLERKLYEALKVAGGWAVKWTSPQVNGVPDRIVFLPDGRIYFVELKSTGKHMRDTQRYVAAKLHKMGHFVYEIGTAEQLIFFLEQICDIPHGHIRP